MKKITWGLLAMLPGVALAQTEVSGGDTAWIMTSTALVLFMSLPGLALFYGGLVRAKNVLSVLVQCFAIVCVVSVLWLVCGYSLAFAESLLPTAKLRGYRKLLSRVQDILGEINDLAVAKDYYESCTATHPQAWFALGWISARLKELAEDAQLAFDDLAASKPFWK